MFELSHRLIGIYKTANATRSVFVFAIIHWQMLTVYLAGISIDNHALTTVPIHTVRPVSTASVATAASVRG